MCSCSRRNACAGPLRYARKFRDQVNAGGISICVYHSWISFVPRGTSLVSWQRGPGHKWLALALPMEFVAKNESVEMRTRAGLPNPEAKRKWRHSLDKISGFSSSRAAAK